MNPKKLLPIVAVCLLACASQNSFAYDGGKHKEHKEIDIEGSAKHQVRIKIKNDGKQEVFKFNRAELEDTKLMEKRLAGLDNETKAEVMDALEMMKSHKMKGKSMHAKEHEMELHHDKQHEHKAEHREHKKEHRREHKAEHKNKHKNKHKSEHMDEHRKGDDHRGKHSKKHKMIKKIIKSDHSDDKGGKADIIVRLLKHGKFTKEQMISIQKALDAKK